MVEVLNNKKKPDTVKQIIKGSQNTDLEVQADQVTKYEIWKQN
jgi:hypothetical protein